MCLPGYGDIYATNDVERFFSILTQVLGAAFFGFIVGSMSSLLDSMDLQSVQRKDKIGTIKAYMNDRGLPKDLSARVLTYYHYYLERVSCFDEQDILSELSNNLRAQVMVEANAEVLFSIRLFRQLDRRFYALMFVKLKPLLAISEEVVAQQGFTATEMYFLQSGLIEQFITVPAITRRRQHTTQKKKKQRYPKFGSMKSALRNSTAMFKSPVKRGAAKAAVVATWRQDSRKFDKDGTGASTGPLMPSRGLFGRGPTDSTSSQASQVSASSTDSTSSIASSTGSSGIIGSNRSSSAYVDSLAGSLAGQMLNDVDVRPRVESNASASDWSERSERTSSYESDAGGSRVFSGYSEGARSAGSEDEIEYARYVEENRKRDARAEKARTDTVEMPALPAGKIKLMTYDDLDDIQVAEHASGSHFGEVALLQYKLRIASFKSRGYSNLYCLSLHDLNESLMECPSLNNSMPAIARTRSNLIRHIKLVMMLPPVANGDTKDGTNVAKKADGSPAAKKEDGSSGNISTTNSATAQQLPGSIPSPRPMHPVDVKADSGAAPSAAPPQIKITARIRQCYSLNKTSLDAYNVALPEVIKTSFIRQPTCLVPNRYMSKRQFKERSESVKDLQKQQRVRRKSLMKEYGAIEHREEQRRRSLVGDEPNAISPMPASLRRLSTAAGSPKQEPRKSSSVFVGNCSSPGDRAGRGLRDEDRNDGGSTAQRTSSAPAEFAGSRDEKEDGDGHKNGDRKDEEGGDTGGGGRGSNSDSGPATPRNEGNSANWAKTAPQKGGDGADKEDFDDALAESNAVFIFHPHAPWRTQWDLGVGVLIMYSVLVIPFRIGFGVDCLHTLAFAFDCIVDITFFIDIVLNFRTPFFDRTVGIVVDPWSIASRYIRSWFTIDFLSTVPIDMIVQLALTGSVGGCGGSGSSVRSIKLVRVLRLIRLIKLVRVLKLAKALDVLEEDYGVSPTMTRLAKLCLQMSFFAHMMSCSFYFSYSQFDNHPNWVDDYSPHTSVPNQMYATNFSASLAEDECGWFGSMCHSGRGDLGPYHSYAAAVGDLNGDGIDDVVVANKHEPNELFLSTGEGVGSSFVYSTHVLVADSPIATTYVLVDRGGPADDGWLGGGMGWGAASSKDVSIGDVNGDGLNDVVVINVNQPNQLFHGDGKGGFTAVKDSPISQAGRSNSFGVAIADLNGDGVGDVLVVNSGEPNELYLSDGVGDLLLQSASTLATVGFEDLARAVAVADVTGDGKKDVVVVNFGQKNQLFVGDGIGGFVHDAASAISTLEDRHTEAVAAADLNGDGVSDLVMANLAEANEVYLSGAGGLALNADSPLSEGSSENSLGVAVADLTGDGIADVLVVNQFAKHQLFVNSFAPASAQSSGTPFALTLDKTSVMQASGRGYSYSVAVGDINGDSYNDVLVLNRGQTGIHDSSLATKYCTSVYWAFSTITTTGYGDVTPENDVERVVAMICMLLCALLFGYVIGSLATLVTKLNVSSGRRDMRMNEIRQYAEDRGLSQKLTRRLVSYYNKYVRSHIPYI
jgi:hypothetical protein